MDKGGVARAVARLPYHYINKCSVGRCTDCAGRSSCRGMGTVGLLYGYSKTCVQFALYDVH